MFIFCRSLSRDDIIDLEPLYDDAIGHCSRAARVSVSKSCVPPGSVIILAEEVNTGEVKCSRAKRRETASYFHENVYLSKGIELTPYQICLQITL